MKLKSIMVLAFLFIFTFSSSAKLRSLGNLDKVNCVNNNEKHIVITSLTEWDAISSIDCGNTWTIIKKTELPRDLTPLPSTGTTRYIVAEENTLLCSKDSGKTWLNISPWSFLWQDVRERVQKEKALYLKHCGSRIPSNALVHNWYIGFLISVALVLLLPMFLVARRDRLLVIAAARSLITYVLIGVSALLFAQLKIDSLVYRQWNNIIGGSGDISFPQWHLGVLLNLVANPYYAPLLCLVLFPTTPLFGEVIRSISNKRWQNYTLYGGLVVSALFIGFALIAIYTGNDWYYWDIYILSAQR